MNEVSMKKDATIHIALADDHAIFRKGTSVLLTISGRYSVDIEAENGKDLIEQINIAERKPDICLLDIRMPVMNGQDALIEIRRRWPQIKVIILSSHDHEHIIINTLRNGACGYILKDADPEELFAAIDTVHEKGYYHTDLIPGYFAKFAETPELSDREVQFLHWCCEEITYKEMGTRMNVSARTIENYRETLFEKLHVTCRTGLVMFAVRNGIV